MKTPQSYLAVEPLANGIVCALFYVEHGDDVYGWWSGTANSARHSQYFQVRSFFAPGGRERTPRTAWTFTGVGFRSTDHGSRRRWRTRFRSTKHWLTSSTASKDSSAPRGCSMRKIRIARWRTRVQEPRAAAQARERAQPGVSAVRPEGPGLDPPYARLRSGRPRISSAFLAT